MNQILVWQRDSFAMGNKRHACFNAQVAFFAVLIELLRLILVPSAELPHRVNA